MTATITNLAEARAARGLPPALRLPLCAGRPSVGDRVIIHPQADAATVTPTPGTVEAILPAPPGAPPDAVAYRVRTVAARHVVPAHRVAWPEEE